MPDKVTVMGEQQITDQASGVKPGRLKQLQSFTRRYKWFPLLLGIAAVLFGFLIVLTFGGFVLEKINPKQAATVASAVYLAVGAILQAVLASLTSSGRLPRPTTRPGPPGNGPTVEDGWPDLLNLSGWGFVTAGAILAALVAIAYP
jgi:hypothetical protein